MSKIYIPSAPFGPVPLELKQCLQPREMAGLLMSEQTAPQGQTFIPSWFQAHLESCKPCKTDWDLVVRSDPILRQAHGAGAQPQ